MKKSVLTVLGILSLSVASFSCYAGNPPDRGGVHISLFKSPSIANPIVKLPPSKWLPCDLLRVNWCAFKNGPTKVIDPLEPQPPVAY